MNKHLLFSIKSFYTILLKRIRRFSCLAAFLSPVFLFAQCPDGYTSATLNWDNMDYLHSSGSYYGGTNPVTGLPFVSAAMRQTQKFAIGTNQLTISTTIPIAGSGSTFGDITTHTGETGAHGTGADLGFIKTGTAASTITLTFLTEVQNLKFSVFDIDQEITFAPTATNDGGNPVSITLIKPAGVSSAIPLNGSAAATTISGNTPLANWTTGGGSGTAYATSSNNGTINVEISGPVKTVILSFSNDGNTNDFWISDITACVIDPGFPSNYYAAYTEPFTGQPAYFLANPGNLHVYMVNPSTAVAEYIFSDPGSGGTKLNSLAYDPINKWLYYVMDNATQAPGNKALKKYDFNTETISTVLSDINTLGIPTFLQGVEYAGAAFYNGSLYFGVEECDGQNYNNGAESVVWKIDFNGAGVPTSATQVYGTPGDNGSGTVMQDWGDIIVKDGTLISAATSATTSSNQYIHTNLQTGVSTAFTGNAEASGQLGMIWNGTVYRIKNAVAVYNNDGTIGSATSITTTSCSSAWTANAGDGSDPFKPKCDFGDAPASYDPVALSPAAHQKHCNNATLRLGSTWDREWSKVSSANAISDSTDEDGISTVTVLIADGSPHTFVQTVSVFNNTGADATLGGWLDYDLDGVFETSEGIIVTVAANGSLQNVNLSWPNLNLANGTPGTFLRIRLVSGTGTLTTSNATGWYSDGEVEDYPVVTSDIALGLTHIDLHAHLTPDKKVRLNWIASVNEDASGFDIERNTESNKWQKIGVKNINFSSDNTSYSFIDPQPAEGNSYYRVKLISSNSPAIYSVNKWIYLEEKTSLKLMPNPASDHALISLPMTTISQGTMNIRSLLGQHMITKPLLLTEGENWIPIDVAQLNCGVYLVEIILPNKKYFTKLIINR